MDHKNLSGSSLSNPSAAPDASKSALFASLDTDGDGELSLREFHKAEAASLDTRLKYIGAPQYIMPAIARRLRAIERRTSTKSWMLGWKRCGYKDLDFQVALISQGCRFGRPSTLDQRTACRQVMLMFSSFVYIKRWSDLRAWPCLESLVMLVWAFLMFLVAHFPEVSRKEFANAKVGAESTLKPLEQAGLGVPS